MRIFKSTRFDRFARKEGISDNGLRAIVNKTLEENQAEANLGGGVYKVRVARPGGGKSGGYRVIVFFRSGFRTFFAHGFAKSDRANIGQMELRWYKDDARDIFALSETQVNAMLASGTLIEVLREDENEV